MTPHRRLTRRMIQDVRRQVEREQRVQLPKDMRVVPTSSMPDQNGYARWTGERTRDLLGLRRVRVIIYERMHVAKQQLALHHELTEIAGVLKGQTVPQAHRGAMRDEKRHLAKLPFRTTRGTPYRKTLSLMRAPDAPSASSRAQRALSAWIRRLLAGVGLR